jgi:hypothetical protein
LKLLYINALIYFYYIIYIYIYLCTYSSGTRFWYYIVLHSIQLWQIEVWQYPAWWFWFTGCKYEIIERKNCFILILIYLYHSILNIVAFIIVVNAIFHWTSQFMLRLPLHNLLLIYQSTSTASFLKFHDLKRTEIYYNISKT